MLINVTATSNARGGGTTFCPATKVYQPTHATSAASEVHTSRQIHRSVSKLWTHRVEAAKLPLVGSTRAARRAARPPRSCITSTLFEFIRPELILAHTSSASAELLFGSTRIENARLNLYEFTFPRNLASVTVPEPNCNIDQPL